MQLCNFIGHKYRWKQTRLTYTREGKPEFWVSAQEGTCERCGFTKLKEC